MGKAAPFAPLIGGALAGAGSASGGKKGSDAASQAAQQQAQIQQQQLQFGQRTFDTGMKAWQPSVNYWEALLKGGPAAAQAMGPAADLTRQAGTAAGNQIMNTLPSGGERNLALGTNATSTANNLSRLTAGVQPTAAAALGQLSGLPVQAGVGIMGQGAPNVGAQLKYQTHQQEMKNQGAGGLGSMLYNITQRWGQNGGGKGSSSASPTAGGGLSASPSL